MEPETFKPNLREASDLLEADQIEKVSSKSNVHMQPSRKAFTKLTREVSKQANEDATPHPTPGIFSVTKAVNAT